MLIFIVQSVKNHETKQDVLVEKIGYVEVWE